MRALTRLVVVIVLLAVLGVLADAGARRLAEDRVGARIQASEKLTAAPRVSIAGFPFLGQAVRGRYDRVTVRTGAVSQPGTVALSSVDAQLTGVSLPLRGLTFGQVAAVPVDDVRAQALVPYSALASVLAANLPRELTKVSLARAATGDVEVAATYAIAGFEVPLRAQVHLALDAGRLVVSVPVANLTAIPAQLRTALADRLVARLVLPPLPYGLTVSGIAVRPDGVAFTAHGTGIDLQSTTKGQP